jgi:hypothetical protein
MGKTGVASAGSTNAAYFNPALLAIYSTRKHLGENQRIALPAVTAFVSDSILELKDIDDADYKNRLAVGVANFNNNTNIDAFIDTLQSLSNDLTNTSANPLLGDAQANVVFRIPDQHQGGAFYIGKRAVLDGYLNYTAADGALLGDYLEELNFVNGGGVPATLHPELYGNGQLNNPDDSLTSSADAVALIIDELAVSMGWAVTWWDMDMLVGITPKVMHVSTREYTATATGDGLTNSGEYDNEVNLNLDLGWAKQINDRFMVGLTVKNLLPQDYRTASDRYIELQPQVRFGVAYQSEWGDYAADLDVTENAPLSNGEPIRELGLGGEWNVRNQLIRAGVVSNVAGGRSHASPVYTFGFRLHLGTYYSDFSYGRGKRHETAALEVGLRF